MWVLVWKLYSGHDFQFSTDQLWRKLRSLKGGGRTHYMSLVRWLREHFYMLKAGSCVPEIRCAMLHPKRNCNSGNRVCATWTAPRYPRTPEHAMQALPRADLWCQQARFMCPFGIIACFRWHTESALVESLGHKRAASLKGFDSLWKLRKSCYPTILGYLNESSCTSVFSSWVHAETNYPSNSHRQKFFRLIIKVI